MEDELLPEIEVPVTVTDNEVIIALLQEQNDLLSHIDNSIQSIDYASRVITTYGLVVVPLFFVTAFLWWFFKQFLYKF